MAIIAVLSTQSLLAQPQPYRAKSPNKRIALVCGLLVAGLGVTIFSTVTPQLRDYKKPPRSLESNEGIHVYQMARNMSFMPSFRIVDSDNFFGTVNKRFALRNTFEVEDASESVLYRGEQEIFSWGVKINFTDSSGTLVGSLHEEVWESLFKPMTSYTIYDGRGNVIGKSEKLEWLTTEFTIYDSHGDIAATIERPWFSFPEKWNVTIIKPTIDPKLVFSIVAYKSSADDERSSKSRDKD